MASEEFNRKPLRVAVAQLHAFPGHVSGNISRITAAIDASKGLADLLVLPETFLQGYHAGVDVLRQTAVAVPPLDTQGPAAVSATTDALVSLCALARCAKIALVIPFAECGVDVEGRPATFNSSVLIDSTGFIVGHYRKTHLWGQYEHSVFTAGPGSPLDDRHVMRSRSEGVTLPAAASDPYTPFVLPGWPHIPIGLLVCFDLEFPEPARILAVRGARVIVSTHASGEARGFTSTHYVPVRAFENDVAVVYANYPSSPASSVYRQSHEEQSPLDGGEGEAAAALYPPPPPGAISVAYAGGSGVVGPDGVPLHLLPVYACAPEKAGKHCPREPLSSKWLLHDVADSTGALLHPGCDEHIFVVEYDPDEPGFVHNRAVRNPYLRDRRAELFGGFPGR